MNERRKFELMFEEGSGWMVTNSDEIEANDNHEMVTAVETETPQSVYDDTKTNEGGYMILTKEQVKELEEAAKPLVKFLCDNFNPHVTVIVTPTSAKFPKWYRRRWSYKIEESHYTLWVNEDEIELLKEVSGE